MIALFASIAVAGLMSGEPDGNLTLSADNIPQIVEALTTEEKAALVVGTSSKEFDGIGHTNLLVPGAAGTTHPIPRLGIPAIVLADGPAGVRINGQPCTHFPIATVLAATWNNEMVNSIGQSMGQEVLEHGVDVLLAPAINIHRNPLCGRNFEYYSEDPLLAGYMAAAMINGIQSNGVGTSLKHFAVNNEELNRLSSDSRVDEQTLREIYLRNFQIAVRESQPWTIMTSYNYVNGVYTSESKDLLRTLLRDEWGFKGSVMTDWGGGYDAVRQVSAWNDMIQPGSDRAYRAIIAGIEDGSLKQEDLDACVTRILQLIVKSPRFRGYRYSNLPDLDAHRRIAREAATEGIVLLKNEGKALPIAGTSELAVFGVGSYDFVFGGTGSGNVNSTGKVGLIEGLKGKGFRMAEAAENFYSGYMEREAARCAKINKGAKWYVPDERPLETIPSDAITAAAQTAAAAVVTISRVCGEGRDRHPSEMQIEENELKLIAEVAKEFHARGKKLTVLLNVCGPVEVDSWAKYADAVVVCWLPGVEGGKSVADVLSGAENPSGRLPMTFPVKYEDDPTACNFPVVIVNKPYNYSFYRHESGKKFYDIKDIDWINYSEGLFMGYRYFTSRKKAVSYPFGFGLSYTDFAWSGYSVAEVDGSSAEVKVTVTNKGQRAGKDVVEIYMAYPVKGRPVRELKGYAKTGLLQPGESQTVTVRIPAEDIALYDTEASAWSIPQGKYTFSICRDASTPVQSKSISLNAWSSAAHKLFSVEGNLYL